MRLIPLVELLETKKLLTVMVQAITPQRPDAFDSGTQTEAYATEESIPRTLPRANDLVTSVSHSRFLVAHRRRDTRKRECTEGCSPSCAVTEDWMDLYSPVDSSRSSVSEDNQQRHFKVNRSFKASKP
jgi:hypothetical protein